MIVTSVCALFGALAPVTVRLFLARDDVMWRVSSFVLLLLMLGQITFVHRGMPAEQATGPFRLVAAPVGVVLTVGSISLQLALALVVLGVARGVAAAIYSVAVLFLLLASSYHFLALVRGAQPDVSA